MATQVLTAEAVALAVVRGERPIADLADVGIHMTFGSQSAVVKPSPVVVSPTVTDVVAGIRAYQHDPAALRRWGLFMMAASCVDFDLIEDDPLGDDVIEAVWDASFSGQVDE